MNELEKEALRQAWILHKSRGHDPYMIFPDKCKCIQDGHFIASGILNERVAKEARAVLEDSKDFTNLFEPREA